MSGIDYSAGSIRKGAKDSMEGWIRAQEESSIRQVNAAVGSASRAKAERLLVVSRDEKALGVIHLKDIVKPGIVTASIAFAPWASDRDGYR